MSALIPPGLDLRCDSCGEPVESDNDPGNEDFRHVNGASFYCDDGTAETCARVNGHRKVAQWRAGYDLDPTTHRQPAAPAHDAAWIRQGLEWAVANGVEVQITFRAGPR